MKMKYYTPYYGASFLFMMLYFFILVFISCLPLSIYYLFIDRAHFMKEVLPILSLPIIFLVFFGIMPSIISFIARFFVLPNAMMDEDNLYVGSQKIPFNNIDIIEIDFGEMSKTNNEPMSLTINTKKRNIYIIERPSFRLYLALRKKCKFERLKIKSGKLLFIVIPILALVFGAIMLLYYK